MTHVKSAYSGASWAQNTHRSKYDKNKVPVTGNYTIRVRRV
jgi:hypothetical protein